MTRSIEVAMQPRLPDSPFVEFARVVTVGAFAVSLPLHHAAPPWRADGWHLFVLGAFAAMAYAVSPMREPERRLVLGPLGVMGACGVAALAAVSTGAPWSLNVTALLVFLVVWAPWTETAGPETEGLLWLAASTPFVMLLVGPPLGDLSWLPDLMSFDRIGRNAGTNEVGIASALAVVAVLALRMQRRTIVLLVLQAVVLSLAAAAGTRSAAPAVVAAGITWWRAGGSHASWRGRLLESIPWLCCLLFSAGPVIGRTVDRVGEGVDRLTSGRLTLWREYLEIARDAPWIGHGFGHTERVIDAANGITEPAHNVPLQLVVELGIPAGAMALVALGAVIVLRSQRIQGPDRWLLRIPVVVLLPSLALLDHPLRKPALTIPILTFSAAAAGLSRRRANVPADAPAFLSPDPARPAPSRPG